MLQDYRIVLETLKRAEWTQLGERHIRTRSLNSAKAQATNFTHRFEEMRYFAGKLDSGWSKSVNQNGDGLLFVSRRHTDLQGREAFVRVEWLNPQLKLYDEIADQRIHESWVYSRLRKQLELLLG